ncbi:hypothetical protein F5051DRAFT_442508 [Lentinula edodes]|nr:hypothetical protein F5051DRAFT_442508 [Lentinula edodes]
MKEMVDWAIAAHKSTGRPILYNAILKQADSTVPVASIHATPLDNISQYVEAGNNRPPPVAAAIYGSRAVGFSGPTGYSSSGTCCLPTLSGWQEEISQFDLEIAYIPGDDNVGADALSQIQAGALP